MTKSLRRQKILLERELINEINRGKYVEVGNNYRVIYEEQIRNNNNIQEKSNLRTILERIDLSKLRLKRHYRII